MASLSQNEVRFFGWLLSALLIAISLWDAGAFPWLQWSGWSLYFASVFFAADPLACRYFPDSWMKQRAVVGSYIGVTMVGIVWLGG